ncbi:MAG TPA: hypothetical protein VF518_15135 [Polyangia bacterium]
MKKLGISLVAAFFVLAAAAPQGMAKGKAKASAAKPDKPRGPAPVASADAISEIRGDFKWGMTAQQVVEKINARIEATYKEKLAATTADPNRNDKLRKQMRDETSKTGKNLVKFDGQKGPWDVSIIDQEIVQSAGQTMLLSKESKATRYFFFANDSLYKMYIAFDKDMLAGKNFKEFGAAMQGKFGKAQEVWVNQSYLGVKEKKLDHLLWRSTTGDGLKLVDRSEFYDVFCLVLYDQSVDQRMQGLRKEAEANQPKGDMLDNVVGGKPNDRDENDNVIDRITGKETLKPGERRAAQQNIKVPAAGDVDK